MDFQTKLAVFFLLVVIASTLPWGQKYLEHFSTTDAGSFNSNQKPIPHEMTNWKVKDDKLEKGTVNVELVYDLCTTHSANGTCLNNKDGIRVVGIRMYDTLPQFEAKTHMPGKGMSNLFWQPVKNKYIKDESGVDTETMGTTILVGPTSNKSYKDIEFHKEMETDKVKILYNIKNSKPADSYTKNDVSLNLDFYDKLELADISA